MDKEEKGKKTPDLPTVGPEGIPGLDELALRLQVGPAPEPFIGVVLFGKSGRAYQLVEVLANFMQFTAQAFEYMIRITNDLEKRMEVPEKSESNQKPGRTEKANDTDGSPKAH